MPECSLPFVVRFLEGWVDRMEFVMVQWIVDLDFPAVGSGDGNLLQHDHLIRRDGVDSPIPERHTKVTSSLLPLLFVACVASSNAFGMLLQSLLKKKDCHRSV